MANVYHGSIITCDEKNNVFSYLVESDGGIVYVGNELPKEFNDDEMIELGENALLPAFGDGHLHFSSWALINSTVDVRGAKNIKELIEMMKKYAVSDPKASVIVSFGHSKHSVEEGRLIKRSELDEVSKERPVIVICYDGHSSCGNSAMFDMFPEEIRQLRGFDAENGQLFNEAFQQGTDFATGMVSTGRLIKGILGGADQLAKQGISIAHAVEGIGFPKDIDVTLASMVAKGSQLSIRIFFQTMEVEKVLKRKLPRIGGCFSTALDGCFGATDAALHEPYLNDSNNKGILFHSDETVNKFVKKANRASLQISMHVIGDAAVTQAINAYEAALKDFPREDHRHTLIHACLIKPEDIERIAKLKLLVTYQPAFLISPLEPMSYLKEILGDRAMNGSPIRKMIDLGIHVAGGSDAPVTPPDPIEGMYGACNHFNPSQSVTISEALRMFTYEVAYGTFDEKARGSLEKGKIADLVILNKNPLEMDAKNLRELKVEKLLLKAKPYKGKKGALGMALGGLLGKKNKI